jgi:hypothetical protein
MAEIHQCQYPNCQELGGNPEAESHRRMNLFLSRLDEQQRRWYVGWNRSEWVIMTATDSWRRSSG